MANRIVWRSDLEERLTVELERRGPSSLMKRQLKHCVDRFPELADE
jgi:hypothetical protein